MKTKVILPAFSRALALCCLLAACGDDGDGVAATGAPGGQTRPDGGASPRFIVHSAITNPDNSRTNYFSVVSDLAAPQQLDYGKAIELIGRPRLYVAPAIGFVGIADSESRTLTRYEVADDGTLRPGNKLSLLEHVTALEAQGVHFVSATKAYYKDPKEAKILVLNPTAMTLDRVLPLPRELLVPDQVTNFSRWAGRAGEAYLAVSTTDKDFTRVLPGTTLVRIDTATDEITLTREERCRGIDWTANVSDTLYFFSSVINGFGQAVYPSVGGQPDCTLRILPGQKTFDASYLGSMAPALGGQVGTIAAATADGEAWAQVIDPAVMPTAPGTKYTEWYARGWRWVHLTLPALASAVETGLPAGAFSSQAFSVGSQFYLSQASAQYGTTTLVELSSGTPKPGVSFGGFPLDVARVR